MSQCLSLKKSNCKNCYKCIRICPVKSISFSGNQARIDDTDCILCGRCFVICPQNAKQIVSEIEKVRVLLSSGAPVIASVAPSFVAKYHGVGIESIRKALQKIGFADAEETAIGATIVKREYDRILTEDKRDVVISTCCHSVNLLVEKYFPHLVPYLADVLSPMLAHCQDIKRRTPEAKTVFIGPCIAKKDEAARSNGLCDAVLTYDEFSQMLEEAHIELEQVKAPSEKSAARIFPTNGGVLATMKKDAPGYTYFAVDGPDHCLSALRDLEKGNIHNCFIEMSACIGSCIGGPMLEHAKRGPIRDFMEVASYTGKEDFEVEQPDFVKIKQSFSPLQRSGVTPGDDDIQRILVQMGKTKAEDELNCGTCGYNTCREKAIAVFQGRAEISMCLPFLKERAEDFNNTIVESSPNGLIVVNENMEVQQINSAARRILNLRSSATVLGNQVVNILDPNIFLDVMSSGRGVYNRRTYLADYGRYVEQTVVYNRNYHLLVCIMRDVTDEEIQREKKENITQRTVEVADRVVAKQMRIVQEIASLLGETAAETKVALANLKESITNE